MNIRSSNIYEQINIFSTLDQVIIFEQKYFRTFFPEAKNYILCFASVISY